METTICGAYRFGKAGRGNSSMADNLAKLYGIPTERVFHGGDIVKKIKEEQGELIVGPYTRDPRIDHLVDARIIELIMSATTENPVIIESKLAGLFMHHIEHLADEQEVVLPAPRWSIIKEATAEKSAQIQITKGELKDMSQDLMIGYITGRDEQDEQHWRGLYGWMDGWTNILEHGAKCNNGSPIYNDLIVAQDSPELDIRDAHIGLLRVGLIEKMKPQLAA